MTRSLTEAAVREGSATSTRQLTALRMFCIKKGLISEDTSLDVIVATLLAYVDNQYDAGYREGFEDGYALGNIDAST